MRKPFLEIQRERESEREKEPELMYETAIRERAQRERERFDLQWEKKREQNIKGKNTREKYECVKNTPILFHPAFVYTHKPFLLVYRVFLSFLSCP